MSKVILSVEDFLANLGVGSRFWHMVSCFGAPSGIEGPLTILKFRDNNRIVICKGDLGHLYIGDLTNRWHGVFLNPEDAQVYFFERQREYERNPVLIAEKLLFKRQLSYMQDVNIDIY